MRIQGHWNNSCCLFLIIPPKNYSSKEQFDSSSVWLSSMPETSQSTSITQEMKTTEGGHLVSNCDLDENWKVLSHRL